MHHNLQENPFDRVPKRGSLLGRTNHHGDLSNNLEDFEERTFSLWVPLLLIPAEGCIGVSQLKADRA
eukprot:5616706-Prorocentrum_lima.AAC.1